MHMPYHPTHAQYNLSMTYATFTLHNFAGIRKGMTPENNQASYADTDIVKSLISSHLEWYTATHDTKQLNN